MGCDIHVYVEVKINDKWKHVDSLIHDKYNEGVSDLEYLSSPHQVREHLFENRNYTLFGLLAGVRDNSLSPIAPPRGIPDDTSDTIRETWELDGDHTPHYYTLVELESVKVNKLPKYSRTNLGYFFYKNSKEPSPLMKLQRIRDKYKVNSEQVRIVFWFDS